MAPAAEYLSMNIQTPELQLIGGEPSAVDGGGRPAIDLHRHIALFRRRLKLFLALALIVFLAAVVFTLMVKPRYTATSEVMLDPRQQKVTDVQEVLSGLPADSSVVDTEVEVLKSRTLADKVATALNLDDDPEFNWALAPPSLWRVIVESVTGSFVKAGPKTPTSAMQEQMAHAKVIDHILGRLKVTRSGLTYVIKLSFESTSAQRAALIANTYADKYLLAQLDAKFDATKRATDWLNSRLAGLRQQAETSDAIAHQFEAANGLVGIQGSQGATITQQEISNLNTQIAASQAQQSEAEANLQTARAQLANGSTGEDVGGALTSPVIQELRKQRTDISAQVADFAGRYGPNHPEMLKIQRQLADVDAQIHAEIQRIVSNLQAQVQVARQRTASLEASLSRARGSFYASNSAAAHLAELQSRAQSDQSVYQSFLDRFKQTSAQQGVEQSDAQVVSYAKIPTLPSFPNVPLNLALGAVLGLAAAMGSMFLMEALENGLYTSEDVEKVLGLPHLGSIPALNSTADLKRGKRPSPPLDYMLENPLSSFAESFRNLRTSVLFARVGEPVRVVTITSSVPGEGKTLTSICLGRTLALGGTTTVIVDCDLRQRNLLRQLGRDVEVGLLEVLAGTATLDQALILDEPSGAHLLPLAKGSSFTPKDVFASSAMDRLLEQLRALFEVVVLDTAPVLPIADTKVLAPKSDIVVFLAHWRKTPRKAVENSLKQLDAVGAHIGGVALTLVDAKEQARSGYGDAGYYYKSYRSYYGYGAN